MKLRLALITFCLICVSPAFAANYGEISVQYVPLCSPLTGTEPTTHGMIEHRFRVQNRSASKSTTVGIELKSDPRAEYGLRSASGSVEVPAGQTAQIVILQPPVPMSPIDAHVRINGYLQNSTIGVNVPTNHCDPYAGMFTRSAGTTLPSNAHILVSGKTGTAFRDLFAQGVKPKGVSSDPSSGGPPMGMGGMGMGGGMGMPGMGSFSSGPAMPREITLWRSEGDVDQWSDNWLALTRFDAVLVTANELATIPDSQPIGKALRRYVECGGVLCVVGTEWTAPKEWKIAHVSNDFTHWDALVGAAYLLKKPAESSEDAITLIRDKILGDSDAWTTAMRSETFAMRGGYVGFFGDPRRLAEILPTSESKGVPIRAISILIVVFAVLIGPVNVYILSLKNRRIWLLWTVPVISLLASGLVLGTNFIQEGFIRNTSVSSATILDQRREEAITFGIVGFYSTLTPRSGCLFDNGTEPTVVANRTRQLYDVVSYPGGEQNLTSGWVQPRVPAYFGIRKAATDLRRLEFNWTVEPPTVVNQLGVDLEKLTVCSPEGTFFETEKIIAGEKTALKKLAIASSRTPGGSSFASTLSRFDQWPLLAEALQREPERLLTPGTYLAPLGEEKNPFLEPGISDAQPFLNKSIIFGLY